MRERVIPSTDQASFWNVWWMHNGMEGRMEKVSTTMISRVSTNDFAGAA